MDRVTHDRKVPNMITQLRNIVGKDFEEVALVQHVMAGGNIEEWLGTLETMMKRTVKVCACVCAGHPLPALLSSLFGGLQCCWVCCLCVVLLLLHVPTISCPMVLQDLCRRVAEVCISIDLSTLLAEYTSQMAIIGVQLAWTLQVTAALDTSRTQKSIIAETAKHQLMQLAELSSWSCSDIGSSMTRCDLCLCCVQPLGATQPPIL